MTAVVATRGRRSAAPLAFVSAAAVLAWAGTILWVRAGDMGAMPGTMGMSPLSFTAMWALMMAAMMLPSVAPFVDTYQATLTTHRPIRLTALAAGYLAIWSIVGLGAFVLAGRFGEVAATDGTSARAVAAATFAVVGIYQLTPLKFRCLSHCRSPLGHLLHYLGFRGRLRDLRAGISHGWFCLGCCWALMVLMVAFGVMNVVAMAGLAVVIAIEKTWRHGEHFARFVGLACLAYAVAVAFRPGLAPGLDPGSVSTMTGM